MTYIKNINLNKAIALAQSILSRVQLLFKGVVCGISPLLISRAFRIISLLAGVIFLYNLIYSVIGSASSDYMFVSHYASLAIIPRIAAPKQFLIIAPNNQLIMQINRVVEDTTLGKNLKFELINYNLLSGDNALKAIYKTLFKNKTFLEYSSHKTMLIESIMTHVNDERREVVGQFSFLNSVLVNNDTSFEKFYKGLCLDTDYKYLDDYSQSVYSRFIVRVWSADILKNKEINISINPATGLLTAEIEPKVELLTAEIEPKVELLTAEIGPKVELQTIFRESNFPIYQIQTKYDLNISENLKEVSSYIATAATNNESGEKIAIFQVLEKPRNSPNFNFTPLKRLDKKLKPIATMDLETMAFKGLQYPVAISLAYLKSDYKYKVKEPKVISKLFLIELPVSSLDAGSGVSLAQLNEDILKSAVQQMFNRYLDYCKEHKLEHFLVHNLGAFDGLFLFKALFDYFPANKIKPLMDADHRFIHIKAEYPDGGTIEWKDSFRIFPVGLNDLCSNLGVAGKAGEYLPEFNDLNLLLGLNTGPKAVASGLGVKGISRAKGMLFNKFKKYSLAGSETLLKALTIVQKQYFNDFKVDIMTIYSAASLTMKVFRLKFFPTHVAEIPLLRGERDFVEKAYYDSVTDVFKRYAENVHCYDINSLYPYAQSMPMPFKCLGYRKLKSLDDFFGFVEVEVTAPLLAKPILPMIRKGKIIFPTGTWKGIYFSEELKVAAKLGYKFKIGRAFEYSKEILFKDYIDHFYSIQKTSTGLQRFISKMMLNNLVFGTAIKGLKPLIVENKDVMYFITSLGCKVLTNINDKYTMIITHRSERCSDLWELESSYSTQDIGTIYSYNRFNEAINAAISSYARIHMLDLKLNYDVCYSDNNSIFTTHPLPNHLIGPNLDQLKDKLEGTIIDKAYFIGIKQYGYTYKDLEGNRVDKSVWNDIARDTIPFDIIEDIASGATHNIKVEKRLFRNYANLNAIIKSDYKQIVDNKEKLLVGNQYYPDCINNPNI